MSARTTDKPDTATAPKRVFIETYGCQMNVADSQLITGILSDSGYERAPALDQADVILVNTCAVRERAEERVLARLANINPQKIARPDVVLGVIGCMAEHFREDLLKRVPQVDLVAGPDSYRRLPSLISAAAGSKRVVDVQLDKEETYEGAADSRVDGINGWVSVQRGCDKFCTFCIVPFVRGRERSAPPREVLRQTRAVVGQGAKEITLLGQTVNSYRYGAEPNAGQTAGKHDHLEEVDFADLLVAVSAIDGVERVRFTSPHPRDFTTKLIETMAALPKVMPHIHLPVQSGCDIVLERMKRGHAIAEYLDLVKRMRETIDGLAITTDLIVGFPDESDASFERTLELVRAVRFDAAFMFMYSERSKTYASKHYPDSIPRDLKRERLERLIDLQEGISAEINATYVGRTVQVLVTGPSRRSDRHLVGKTGTFKSTVFAATGDLDDPEPAEPPGSKAVAPIGETRSKPDEISAGDLVDVEIYKTTSHTLLGRRVGGGEGVSGPGSR